MITWGVSPPAVFVLFVLYWVQQRMADLGIDTDNVLYLVRHLLHKLDSIVQNPLGRTDGPRYRPPLLSPVYAPLAPLAC